MTKAVLPIALGLSILSFCLFVILPKFISPAYSSLATNIVFSEIQIAGGTASDEFIELYNPTDSAVIITDWKIKKKSGGSQTETTMATLIGSIPAYGYFLIANNNYDGPVSGDQNYSLSIGSNNTLLLYTDSLSLVDKIGMGTPIDPEGSPTLEPTAGQSIERKAASDSTADSMTTGSDVSKGNGYDSNDNESDFILRLNPDPQNSSSTSETPPSPTPTSTPISTPTPTQEPTPEPTPEPTVEPTPTPTPEPTPEATPEPTPDPTIEPTPTPTLEPSQSPTPSPEPTLEPTLTPTTEPESTVTPTPEPTIEPTLTPYPSPTPSTIPIPTPKLVKEAQFLKGTYACYIHYRPIYIFDYLLFLPYPKCGYK